MHGGVYAIVVEGVASVGACVAVRDRDMYAVGTSNATDFLRPVTVADLEVVAEPIFQGRTQQLWQVSITRIDATAGSSPAGSCGCRTCRSRMPRPTAADGSARRTRSVDDVVTCP